MTPILQVDRGASHWTLILNRPDKMNALSADLVERLLDAVADAQRQDAELLVFRGEGKSFSAGFDFAHIETQSEADLLLRFVRIEQLLQAIHQFPGVTVGLAHGRVFGAGVDLLGVCKWRCAAPDASFRMPGLKFGLVLGSHRFAQAVGAENARRILESARMFSAREALDIGFLHRFACSAEWPEVIAAARGVAAELPVNSRQVLDRVIDPDRSRNADRDLAHLVRSAAHPQLKSRILSYLAESSRGRSKAIGQEKS